MAGPSGGSRSVVVEERSVLGEPLQPLPDEPRISAEPLPPGSDMSPVAQSLLARSDALIREGEWDAASNSLERALRLEPNNAVLWNKLAGVRYQQQDWQQAIQLAAKSNTLVVSDNNLKRRNWNMMANAYHSLGDTDSAQKYRSYLSR